MANHFHPFHSVWVVDFEYRQREGENPEPWCAVGLNLVGGEQRVWRCAGATHAPVYTAGPCDLVVAFAAEAEGGCIRALGWPMPAHCIDLRALFLAEANTFGLMPRGSLLEALAHYNLPGMATVEKDAMRELAIRGAPFTTAEMADLVGYCREDVMATARLLGKLWNGKVALPHALLMGRYTLGAVSAMERTGIPVDADFFHLLQERCDDVRRALVEAVDAQYGVYKDGSFKTRQFQAYLAREGLAWPTLPSGRLNLDGDTFKARAQLHPQLEPLRELRKTLSKLRPGGLAIGRDGRNRTALMPFASRTGRNQPSSTRFVYGWPKWVRHFIAPPPGKALLLLDYEQQEFLVGAALARDERMIHAYESGDPYMQTAINAGEVPAWATKEQFPHVRERYKTATLSLQYGCEVHSLGERLGNRWLAADLIASHKRIYNRYHAWCDEQVGAVLLGEDLSTPFGWRIAGGDLSRLNHRSAANWKVQAAGADILRIATISLVEHGFEVAAPIHDGILIIADLGEVEAVEAAAKEIMVAASTVVLGGRACRVECKVTLPGSGYCGEPEPGLATQIKRLLREGAAL